MSKITKPKFIETSDGKIPYTKVIWKIIKTENYSPFVYSTSMYGGILKSEHYGRPMFEMGDFYIRIVGVSPVEQQNSLDYGDKVLFIPSNGEPEIVKYVDCDGYGMGVIFENGLKGTVSYSKCSKIIIDSEELPLTVESRIISINQINYSFESFVECEEKDGSFFIKIKDQRAIEYKIKEEKQDQKEIQETEEQKRFTIKEVEKSIRKELVLVYGPLGSTDQLEEASKTLGIVISALRKLEN